MPLDLVRTLAELVSLPSVNPMGKAADGPEYFEHRVTAYLEDFFRRLELPWKRCQVEEGRENIVARVDGTIPPERGGRVLLLEAHQDTVPTAGMTIAPFEPATRNGRLYGRGACDVKGGMTAMLVALARLARERPKGMPTVFLAATINEEHGFTGATALAESWRAPGGFIPKPPDAAIVAEPTRLDVVVAHKGVVRWRCHTRGRAAHSSQPELGDNAIFRMTKVLAALEKYQKEMSRQAPAHPLCGRPTLSVGTIEGGLSVNTVPDRVTIEIDRRLCPGQEADVAYQEVIRFVQDACGADWPIEHERPFLVSRTLSDADNAHVAEHLLAAARSCGAASKVCGVPFGTDAAAISAGGVPAVVFGPGSIDQAHTADEWIELDQLETASEILFEFARRA